MSFFTAVQPLVQATGKLNITIFPGPDGKLKVSVTPSAEKGKEAALATPLALAATAEELDAGFVEAIQKYATAHKSLADQVAATTAILEQAKSTQTSKASKALSGKSASSSAPKSGGAKTAKDDNDDGGFGVGGSDDDDDDSGSDGETSCSTPTGDDTLPVASASPAPVHTGTDLGSLI